jgi:ribosomal-protein-alanine N-acetyltransferase
MDIRRGKVEDIPAFEYLDNLCFPRILRYNRFDFIYYFFRNNVFSLVAEDDEGVHAFLIADIKPPNDGHIVTIDVHPTYRRQGLGKALMDKSERIFKETESPRIVLEVHENNIPAQLFYSNLGFRIEQRLDNYYYSGNGLRLAKKI